MTLQHSEFLELCKKADQIFLTAPAGADGDSVGTQCAFFEIFKKLLPQTPVTVVNEDPCPQRYIFMPFAETFKTSAELEKTWKKGSTKDLWICVDGGPNRLGEKTTVFWNQAAYRAQVDHHRVSQEFKLDAKLNNSEAASTTEIVYDFCMHHKITFTPTLAQNIYVGLIYDTGLFKHSNTTPKVMRIGAHLLEFKFNHTQTAEKVLFIRNAANLKLAQKLLSNMKMESDNRYVWAKITQKDFLDAEAKLEDREGLIDLLFLTDKCEIAALFSEVESNTWKISLRARRLDVAQLAKSLDPNGGGHRLAAGCSVSGEEKKLSTCHTRALEIIEKGEYI